jgi:hypothetical protein
MEIFIHSWKKLLQPDKYKDIIINSLRFLVDDKRRVQSQNTRGKNTLSIMPD